MHFRAVEKAYGEKIRSAHQAGFEAVERPSTRLLTVWASAISAVDLCGLPSLKHMTLRSRQRLAPHA
jgi:hypothetical protein